MEMGRREGEQVDYFRIPEGKTNIDICEYEEDLCLAGTNVFEGGFLSFSSGTTGLPKAVSIPNTSCELTS
jgi:acyl-coenzyme A synthetase/AMP-(fatty) acid ligase